MKISWKILLCALIIAGTGASARAQGNVPFPGDTTLMTRDFDPAHPGQSLFKPVFNDPTLLRQVVNSAWQAGRSSIADNIKNDMGVGNSLGPGLTPYNIAVEMGQPGELSATPGHYAAGSTLDMIYVVKGNWVEFTTTQPTALGKWADPRFSCTYDLTLTISMSLGDTPGPLHMKSVKAQVSNAKIDSHGLIADLVFIANGVAKFFGTNFIAKAENALQGKKFDFTDKMNQNLVPFNALLANFVGQGYSLADALLNTAQALPAGLGIRSLPGAQNGPQLVIFMDSNNKVPLTGDGQITGAIRWKKAWGQPLAGRDRSGPIIAPGYVGLGRVKNIHPYAKAFRIRAIAQSGFAREGTFMPPMSEAGTLQSVTLEPPTPTREGSTPGTGDDYVLHYTIGKLPLDVPLKVEVALNDVRWEGDVGGQQRAIGPDNWTGTITLRKSPFNSAAVLQNSTTLNPNISSAARTTKGAAGSKGEERGIIIVSGKNGAPGDETSLNPQPLPPKSNPSTPVIKRRATRAGSKENSGILAPPPRIQPGTTTRNARSGYDLGATATATDNVNISAAILAAQLPKPPRENPSGILSVSDIDFSMGLITPPR